MIISPRLLLFLVFSFGCLTLEASSSNNCKRSVQELISETSKEDWNQIPPSLTSIGASNLFLLFGVEAARGSMGWSAAFSSGFWVNTAIDPIITILSHVIATKPPKALTEMLSGKGQYLRRATMNTALNTLVVLGLWKLAASFHPEVEITSSEAVAATGLCAAYYFCIQFVKNKLFVELPRRFDAHVLDQMKQQLGEPLTQLIIKAAERGETLSIDRSQVESLFLAVLESAVLKTPFEERVQKSPQLLNVSSIASLLSKIGKGADPSQTPWLRKKLVFEVFKNKDVLSAPELADFFDLGSPLTQDQSLTVIQNLYQRSWRNRGLVWLASLGDQGIGVVLAGGILLRGLTEWAMTPGNPSFWTYFFGSP